MKTLLAALLLTAAVPSARAATTPVSASFESVGPDRAAIEALLTTYTRAVSTKDERLFETLLLNREAPFSGVGRSVSVAAAQGGLRNYESFRKGVFDGEPFTQRFQDVHILQDGALAQVSLVFVNTTAQGSTWGWKTMQLLKVDGRWKIASEFYTGHA